MKNSASLSLLILTTLSGCYAWHEAERVDRSVVTRIEMADASRVCEAIGTPGRACAVRITGKGRCVMFVPPNDLEAVRHESGHCMGQDH